MKTNNLIHLGSRKNISPANILMLKADCNYTHIFLNDGSKILSSTTIGVLEKRLKNFHFFRPNRSVIINLKYITDFKNNTKSGQFSSILLKDETKISISRRKSIEFQKIIHFDTP